MDMTIVYDALVITASIIFISEFVFKVDKKTAPICYHCEAEDTLELNHNIFCCSSCNRVLEAEYVFSNWSEDVDAILSGKYIEFKKNRGGEKNAKISKKSTR